MTDFGFSIDLKPWNHTEQQNIGFLMDTKHSLMQFGEWDCLCELFIEKKNTLKYTMKHFVPLEIDFYHVSSVIYIR